MKNIKKITSSDISKVALFFIVFLFTFILRAHNYERVPTPNHLDEMLYAWSGLSLIEMGVPISWSTLDYPERAMVYKGVISYGGNPPQASVTLYKPWLDEPPLFSLLVGTFAHINHVKWMEFVPSSYIREPMVLIAALVSIMIFLIAKFVSGYWMGILSMLIYGTIPVMVFASRTAMPENLVALMLTITVYLILKFYNQPRFLYLIPLPILAGIAGLSKPTGYFILPLAIFVVLIKLLSIKETKTAIKYSLYMLAGIIPFISIFIWYGMHFDSEIFNRIISIQGFRPVGFGSLAWFFISPSYDTVILKDSWYVFTLLSAAYFIFNPGTGAKRLIVLSFVYAVIIVMLSGGEGDLLAWYRFPSYPFLAILTAWGIEWLVKRADFFATFLGAGLLLGNRSLLVNAFRPNIEPLGYRLIFSGLMAPSVIRMIYEGPWLKKLCQIALIGIIVLGIYFNVRYIYNAFELNCESKSCPIVPSTRLSSLHFPVIWRLLVLDP